MTLHEFIEKMDERGANLGIISFAGDCRKHYLQTVKSIIHRYVSGELKRNRVGNTYKYGFGKTSLIGMLEVSRVALSMSIGESSVQVFLSERVR